MARLLLIEDDEAQRFVARTALVHAGHEVAEAADGPAGLEAARWFRPDAIVCDVMMPGMTGFEVVEALRREDSFAQVPVVMLTALSDRRHMRQGIVAGAADYLVKPYRPEELCAAVLEALARARRRHAVLERTVQATVAEAVDAEKERLGSRYEEQLAELLSARWVRHAGAGAGIRHEGAALLLADLGAAQAGAEPGLPDVLRKTYEAARDTLYLFGADHVLPHGSELLAIFAPPADGVGLAPAARAVRAALAMRRAAAPARPLRMGLHAGDVVLVGIDDGLHGEHGHAVAPGEALDTVRRLCDAARACAWGIAASPAAVSALADAAVGATVPLAGGGSAQELLAAGPQPG